MALWHKTGCGRWRRSYGVMRRLFRLVQDERDVSGGPALRKPASKTNDVLPKGPALFKARAAST
ncbi:hypothetical protein GCM10010987_78240 [Bradyrhizobium guangdongense]|uniref:Uncharacterized protein n=1 Tax=Bradyrhizobium guangdongense TaxID=1325090 RepID=A0AA87WDC8_9BRAD|nr:hypothetical protein GCM10010987_78240 [Bradyrhizobium guangdongense]